MTISRDKVYCQLAEAKTNKNEGIRDLTKLTCNNESIIILN